VRVHIDTERCQGHGHCNLICPQVFGFDEQGFGRVQVDRVPEPLRADVERAERACPERAIEIHGGPGR